MVCWWFLSRIKKKKNYFNPIPVQLWHDRFVLLIFARIAQGRNFYWKITIINWKFNKPWIILHLDKRKPHCHPQKPQIKVCIWIWFHLNLKICCRNQMEWDDWPLRISWDFSVVWALPGLLTLAAAMTSQLCNTTAHVTTTQRIAQFSA